MQLLHRLYAFIFGYFWLPCPKCGEMFGGHQRKPGPGASIDVGGRRMGVCPACDTPELRAEREAEIAEGMRSLARRHGGVMVPIQRDWS